MQTVEEKASDINLLSSVLFPDTFVSPGRFSFVRELEGIIRRFEYCPYILSSQFLWQIVRGQFRRHYLLGYIVLYHIRLIQEGFLILFHC